MNTRLWAALCLATAGSFASAKDESAVTFEVRIITVPSDLALANVPAKEGEAVFLKDAQLKSMLGAACAHRRVNVMQAPRVTLLHDQASEVKMVDTQSFVTAVEATLVDGRVVPTPKSTAVEVGTTLQLRGRIAADRSEVSADVKHADRCVDRVELHPVTMLVESAGGRGKPAPFTQFLQAPCFREHAIEKTNLRIPSGGHVAIAGSEFTSQLNEESRVPVLARIPHVSRLFRNSGVANVKMRTVLVISATVVEPKN